MLSVHETEVIPIALFVYRGEKRRIVLHVSRVVEAYIDSVGFKHWERLTEDAKVPTSDPHFYRYLYEDEDPEKYRKQAGAHLRDLEWASNI